MKFMGVDPGVSVTGLVLVEDSAIKDATTLKTKRVDDSFEDVMRRIRQVSGEIFRQAAVWGPEMIAVESFEDFGAHLRGAKFRYYVPMLIGALDHRLGDITEVVYQSPRRKPEMKLNCLAGAKLFEGQELLTNEHLRDAARHALIAEQDHFFKSRQKE
jgi:hypothetical protein